MSTSFGEAFSSLTTRQKERYATNYAPHSKRGERLCKCARVV